MTVTLTPRLDHVIAEAPFDYLILTQIDQIDLKFMSPSFVYFAHKVNNNNTVQAASILDSSVPMHPLVSVVLFL